MLEAVVYALIQICLVALVIFLVIYVLQRLGIALPPMVINILWIIFMLIVVLMLVRLITGSGGIRLINVEYPAHIAEMDRA